MMDSTPTSPEFFTDTTKSAPASPTPTSSTTNKETPETLRQRINTRRDAYMKKAEVLRARIETEKAKLQTLGEKYDNKPGNIDMNRRIWRSSRYISMLVKNFNLAMAEHRQHMTNEDVSEVAMAIARSKVLEIESRLRIVEVALQGGIEHAEPARGSDVIMGDAWSVGSGIVVEDSSSAAAAADVAKRIDFDREEWFLQLLAAGHQRKNLPPVGHFEI